MISKLSCQRWTISSPWTTDGLPSPFNTEDLSQVRDFYFLEWYHVCMYVCMVNGLKSQRWGGWLYNSIHNQISPFHVCLLIPFPLGEVDLWDLFWTLTVCFLLAHKQKNHSDGLLSNLPENVLDRMSIKIRWEIPEAEQCTEEVQHENTFPYY